MTQQVVGIGTSANDGTGDTPRTAFSKVNSNFTELYSGFFATITSQALARTALGYGSLATLATSGTPSSSNFLRGDGAWTALATVATSGAYADLSGKPTLGTLAALNSASLTTNVTGILPIANGGTGTASPGLVAGTNITVTGSWPNQTINATGGGSGFTGTYDSGTLTTSTPITFTQTWNAAVTFSGFEIDITDTGSIANATSLPFQVNRNGSPLMSVTKFGVFQTVVYQVGTDINNPYMKMYGGSGLGLRAELPIAWGNGTPGGGEVGSVLDTYIRRRAAAKLQLGDVDAAAPVAQTLTVQSVVAGTTNTAGADFTIAGSQGTGTGAGGSIILKTAPAGSSGSAQNALGAYFKQRSTGVIEFSSNGTTALGWLWTAPSSKNIYFNDTDSGAGGDNCNLYAAGFNATSKWGAGTAATPLTNVGTGGVNIASGLFYKFNSAADLLSGSADVALSRNAAGVIEVDSGVVGTYRDLKLRNLIFSDGTQLSTSPARALLTTITPTAVASIAYTSIPSGYSKFEIEFDNVTNANGGANEAPLIALSANNGTTYDSSQCGAANTGLSGAMYGRISIAPVGVTANKIAEGAATQGTVYWAIGGKWTSQTGATNAIRFAWSSGSNFVAQGAIRIYGIV